MSAEDSTPKPTVDDPDRDVNANDDQRTDRSHEKSEAMEGNQAPASGASEVPNEAEPVPDSLGAEAGLRDLMKQAFAEETDDESSVDVLQGFQRKLRDRSGGKFYRDGWSTSRHPPFATYFITSLMMLAVIAVIYAILTPLAGDPIPKSPEPKPVRVIAP